MKCPYSDKCSDEDIKCATCMRNEKSYYVEYHLGDPRPPVKYPRQMAIEWPCLPCDDLRFPTSTIAEDGLEVWDEKSPPVNIFKFSARA